MKKIITILSKFLVPVVIISFLIKKFIKSLDQVKGISININIIVLLSSLAFLTISFFFLPLAWRFILKKLNEKLDLKNSYLIWFKSEIVKYVPGVIWPYIGRVFLAKKNGISKTKTLLSIIIEKLFLVITSVFWSAIFLLPYLKLKFPLIYLYTLTFIITISVLHPKIIELMIQYILRILKKDKEKLKIEYKDALYLFSLYSLRWIFMGVGFILLSNSVFMTKKLPFLIGTFTISWFFGFIVAFAPGGLGIKEGTISLLLGSIMPTSIAIGIALIARVWLIIGEILSLGLTMLWKKRFKKEKLYKI